MFHRPISAARTASGTLWLPQFSLDLIGRSYSLLTLPAELHFASISRSGVGTVDGTFTVCYPDSWQLDNAYTPMALRLTIWVQLVKQAVQVVQASILTGPVVAPSFTTTLVVELYKEYTGVLPTGPTAETIRYEVTSGGGTASLNRDLAVPWTSSPDGPRNRIEILAL